MKETLVGLVIRSAEQGENGKYLTLLTNAGKRYVSVSGARGMKSRFVATAQLFCYAEYQVEVKDGRSYLRDSARIENFYEIFSDPEKSALAAYLCEVAQQVCMENNDESEMLSLILNILYVLVTANAPIELVKAVFETRVVSIQGVAPDLTLCRGCQEHGGETVYLDVMNGEIVCPECLMKEEALLKDAVPADDGTARILLPISYPVRQAIGYVLACKPKRIFAFTLDGEWHEMMGRISESYLLHHLECHCRSLAMYHEMKQLRKQPQGDA